MFDIRGNLFDLVGKTDILCISTNGFVKKNGQCVMGKGCARTATLRWPLIGTLLGNAITESGNRVHPLLTEDNTAIVSFPVKPVYGICRNDRGNVVSHMRDRFKPGDNIPGWACVADIDIIECSAKELLNYANGVGAKSIVLPRPGCGAGELDWVDVKPILARYSDDRFSYITF